MELTEHGVDNVMSIICSVEKYLNFMAESLPNAPHLAEELEISSDVYFKCLSRPTIDSFLTDLVENAHFGGPEHILDYYYNFENFDTVKEIEILQQMTLSTAR